MFESFVCEPTVELILFKKYSIQYFLNMFKENTKVLIYCTY